MRPWLKAAVVGVWAALAMGGLSGCELLELLDEAASKDAVDEAADTAPGMPGGTQQTAPSDDTEQNLEEIRAQAKAGDAVAQFALGNIYNQGLGVPKDKRRALAWFRKAAEKGFAAAQNIIGFQYHRGLYTAQDDTAAFAWYHKAARQGFARAQHNVGVMYGKGLGIEPDLAQAVRWYREAARQGVAVAQYNLGVAYANGEGVAEDPVRAYMWFTVAIAHEAVHGKDNRAVLEESMSPEDIAKAKKMAEAWLTTYGRK